MLLAYALLEQEKHDEAIAEYRRALERNPRDGRVLNNLAIALATSGHLHHRT